MPNIQDTKTLDAWTRRMKYPAVLDSLTNPLATDLRSNPDHAWQHNDENDSVELIEATLGTNPSLGFADVATLMAANTTWDTEIIKASDDARTNTTTYAADSELFFSYAASAEYMVEFWFLYNGAQPSADWKWRFNFSAALAFTRSVQGWFDAFNTSDAQIAFPGSSHFIGSSTSLWPSGGNTHGVDSSNSKFLVQGQMGFESSSAGTCNLEHAQVNLSGSPSRLLIGSRLHIVRLH